ncbi:MAG: 30S ribosomal protein S11 [Parcubacteria group bacterium]
MGKKRIATKSGERSGGNKSRGAVRPRKTTKRQMATGIITVFSTYNNTIVSITDTKGEVVTWSSAGSIGFKGTKKSTPYAATLVAKDAIEKAERFGLKEVKLVIKGVGPGREGAIRGIASSGLDVMSIVDNTPQAHNGVRAPKPRRV